MTIWLWVIVGVAAFLALSILAGLALAAVLGTISRDVSELLESELWASAPLMRNDESEEDVLMEQGVPSERVAGRAVRHG